NNKFFHQNTILIIFKNLNFNHSEILKKKSKELYLLPIYLKNTCDGETNMTEVLEELEEKYEKKKKELDIHRAERDRFDKEADEWADKRDELNKQTKELFKQAKELKDKRDELNKAVQDLKKEKEDLKEKFSSNQNELKEIRKKVIFQNKDRPNISQLKKRLKDLENKQETKVLTKEKEAELVEEIHNLHLQIERMKKEEEEMVKNSQEYMEKKAEFLGAKMKLDEISKKIEEVANEAQTYHDKAMEIFEKAQEIRKAADEAHQNYLTAVQKAREEDSLVHDIIKELKDFEKLITGLKVKQNASRKQEKETELKKVAEGIFEKFKKGEPLTTEDILILQKAGFM
ncbi:MAG: coiled-coil protein, partial [Thermoplasmata archaeon]